MWRSENALEESALSFYLVGPRHQTQVVHLDNKYNYALSSLLSLYAKKTKNSSLRGNSKLPTPGFPGGSPSGVTSKFFSSQINC